MNLVLSFQEFMLNESRVVVKRKYTEAYPERAVSDRAPMREKILSFVNEKGRVSHKEMINFFKTVNEESGRNVSRKWLNKNTAYFKIAERNGEKIYRLSAMGRRVHESIMKQKTV
jgi:hypothetical protein